MWLSSPLLSRPAGSQYRAGSAARSVSSTATWWATHRSGSIQYPLALVATSLSGLHVGMPVIGWIATGGDASPISICSTGFESFPRPRGLSRRFAALGLKTCVSSVCLSGLLRFIALGSRLGGRPSSYDRPDFLVRQASAGRSAPGADPVGSIADHASISGDLPTDCGLLSHRMVAKTGMRRTESSQCRRHPPLYRRT